MIYSTVLTFDDAITKIVLMINICFEKLWKESDSRKSASVKYSINLAFVSSKSEENNLKIANRQS